MVMTNFFPVPDGLLHTANSWGATQAFAAITATTVDASTDFTIGDTVITDGVITDSTGLSITADIFVANAKGIVIGHTAKIAAAGSTPEFQIHGTSNETDDTILVGNWANAATGVRFNIIKSRSGTIGTLGLVADGDDLFRLDVMGSDAGGFRQAAQILVEVDGTPGSNDMPGRLAFSTTPAGASAVTERMRIDSAGRVLIGDTASAEMTTGLVINQGSADNKILQFKSSDVNHGATNPSDSGTGVVTQDLGVEVDDFFTIHKISAGRGGVFMTALQEKEGDSAFYFEGWCGPPSTADTITSQAPFNFFAGLFHPSTANTRSDYAANSNLVAMGEIEADGTNVTRFILKADDGELHLGNTTINTSAIADNLDDPQLSRAMVHLRYRGDEGVLPAPEDDPWFKPEYNFDVLRRLEVVGPRDEKTGEFLIRVQPYLGMHDMQIWQLAVRGYEQEERLTDLEEKLELAERKLVALGA